METERSFPKKVKKFLKNRDDFGTPMVLNLKGNENVPSVWGGIWTILFLLGAYSYAISIFYNFVTHKNSDVSTEEKASAIPSALNLPAENFHFAIQLWNYLGLPVNMTKDFDYLEFYLQKTVVGDDGNDYQSEILMSPCSNETFWNTIYDWSVRSSEDERFIGYNFFKEFRMHLAFCAENHGEFDLVVDGSQMNINHTYYSIRAAIREEFMSNQTKLVEINRMAFVNDYKLAFIYNDIQVDTDYNKDSPYQPTSPYFDVKTINFDANLQQEMDLFLASLDILTDLNVMLENPQGVNNMTVHDSLLRVRTYVPNVKGQPDTHMSYRSRVSFNLKASPMTITMTKEFMKLPEFFGEIEGTICQIAMVVGIIIALVNDKNLPQKIAQRTMKFRGRSKHEYEYLKKNLSDAPSQLERRKTKSIKNIEEEESLNRSPGEKYNTLDIQMIPINIHQNEDKIERVKEASQISKNVGSEEKKGARKLREYELMFSCISCNKDVKKGMEYVDSTGDKMTYYTDIINIIRKFRQLDVLKFILLSDDQLNLLNFLSQPAIIFSENQSEIVKKFNEIENPPDNFEKENIDILTKSYNDILKKEKLTQLDMKLLGLFNSELDSILDD
jgi:hypothetical protein